MDALQPAVSREAILEQLGKLLASEAFRGSARSSKLLRYLVEQTVNGQTAGLKEYALGAEVLGKGSSFDPRTDTIVRAEASRLRSRLEKYFATEGQTDRLLIALPKGSYVPQFEARPVSLTRAVNAATVLGVRERVVWFAFVLGGALAAFISVGMIWIFRDSSRSAEQPVYRFDVELRSNGLLGSEVGTDVIISPDGTRVVFASRGSDGVTRLNTRALDQTQATELPDTEGAMGPFFSPDGRWVGFRASGQLKKIPIDGGLPVVLCDAPDLLGASWADDGTIIAALIRGRLWRVSASGGQPTAVLDLAAESRFPVWPQILPGSKWLLYTTIGATGANGANIEALSLVDGRRTVLLRGGTFGRYLTGYLLYVNQGTLFAIALDPDRIVPLGSANAVVNDVAYSPTFGFAQLDTSRTGTLVYRRNEAGGQFFAEWLDANGKAEPLSLKPGNYAWPRLSPDGQRVAFSAVESGTTTTLVYNIQTNRIARAGSTAEGYMAPLWTPDGNGLILGSAKGMAWLSADDLQSLLPLTLNTSIQIPWSFAPDRTRLAYYDYELNSPTAFDLWTIPIHWVEGHATVGAPEPFLRTESIETYPSFSPDGRWLAYISSESGTQELYVRPFPNSGTKVRVSDAGGLLPIWSPNRRELFYRTPDQRVMVAEYAVTDGSFVVSKSKLWSDQRLGDTGVLPNFDLSPDGKHILALMPAARPQDQQAPNHVTFILNFISEVRRQVSTHLK